MRTGTVYVNIASVPEGKLLSLPGLGAVPNGTEKEVTESQIRAFELQGFEFPESGRLEIVPGTEDPHPVGHDATEGAVDATTEGDE